MIILSGHASMDAAMEINKLGGYDYLMKPCPLEELLRIKKYPGNPPTKGQFRYSDHS